VDVLQMPMQELERVAADLRAYWNDSRDEISTQYAGKPFFTQREVAHLRDVKALVRGVGAMRWVTLGLAAGALGLIVFALRGAAWRQALRACAWAGGVTLALVAFSGLVFLFAFDWAFLLFHRLSFANNFWQLRCPGDNLVCMFPQGFWYDATMTIVLSTVVQAVVLLAVGLAAPWLVRRFARAPSGSRDSLA
jgi:integral membrane protein (TIGR01906 family)